MGNKAFYKHTPEIALPIMIQNGVTNFVSLLDNIMVGRLLDAGNMCKSEAAATSFIIAQAVFMPQHAFIHATYFTLRSGGKTIITFLFDGVFMYALSIPVAFIASRYTTGLGAVGGFSQVHNRLCTA